ncbi:MAG: patatin-like phospholipase family protein [Ardenticatenaceae bacterium]|nr:patatin-like phospholipase family protein [Ardenticatenaceae bacterium]MCB9445149.1 patatin-like phospholipase family protein [Ardenticatenaceae bacterium]
MPHTRKKIGLALGGGVARGPAHIGVLSVLEEAHIPIHCVSGTSAGSVIGAVYCAGLELTQMRHLARQMTWQQIANPIWPHQGLVSFKRMEPWIESYLGPLNLEDLPVPMAAVATDVYTGDPVILREGRLATAVRASSSVPGVVEPVEINGRLLCDGGISANVPVEAARQLGADYVIGVDLFAPEYDERGGPLGVGFSAIETLIRNSGGGVKEADCLIVPAIDDHSYLRFAQGDVYIALGEAAARQKLPQILADLNL